MISYTAFLFCMLSAALCCVGQDTIKREPSVVYPEKTAYTRTFASSVEYAREDIIFSDSLQRVELCYYIATERHCFGHTYRLTGDSTLIVDSTKWQYRKLSNNLYRVSRYYKNSYETGTVSALIPFTPTGIFSTYTEDKSILLWTIDYKYWKPQNDLNDFQYVFHTTDIPEKIYRPDQVDTPPTLADGSTLDSLALHLDPACMRYNEPYINIYSLQVVVMPSGRILNLQRLQGMDIVHESCYVADILQQLYQLSPLKPATRKGKAVPVLWKVRTNIQSW